MRTSLSFIYTLDFPLRNALGITSCTEVSDSVTYSLVPHHLLSPVRGVRTHRGQPFDPIMTAFYCCALVYAFFKEHNSSPQSQYRNSATIRASSGSAYLSRRPFSSNFRDHVPGMPFSRAARCTWSMAIPASIGWKLTPMFLPFVTIEGYVRWRLFRSVRTILPSSRI